MYVYQGIHFGFVSLSTNRSGLLPANCGAAPYGRRVVDRPHMCLTRQLAVIVSTWPSPTRQIIAPGGTREQSPDV